MGPNSINAFRGAAATGAAGAQPTGAAATDGAAHVAGSPASVGPQDSSGTAGSANAGKLLIKYGDALKAGRLQGGLQARDAAYAKAGRYIQGINPDIAMMSARS